MGEVYVTSFTPMPETRRVTGNVVHFEFQITALVVGPNSTATTTEHYKCLRVDDVVRCSGKVLADYVGGSGESESHVRLTCDAQFVRCEATTHFRGVDNTGEALRGKGTISTVAGQGTYTVRLTHG